ncbi:DUF2795 domain-containing protein [Streptomyces sp. CA-111067]|uniref:DUF2795 domain-containing protein n=1 Tax=Streptomyces sp. CA-111067 TaxID=3240046 RepID=UPI003D96D7B4
MTDQGSNKAGFARDDELKRETRAELAANGAVPVQESPAPEPLGEDQPVAEWSRPAVQGSAPAGMTPGDVFVRAELARHLERSIFPARRDTVLDTLRRHQAPDGLLDRAAALPSDVEYPNVQAVVKGLGFGVENRRD